MKDNSTIILVAEDDPDDRLLLQLAFDEVAGDIKLHFTENGEELLSFLKQLSDNERTDTEHPMPALILLDLNMPGKDGFETLAEIKSSPLLKSIPTIIFTGSTLPDHVDKTYSLGGNSYICKPHSSKEFTETINTLIKYWVDICQLPQARH